MPVHASGRGAATPGWRGGARGGEPQWPFRLLSTLTSFCRVIPRRDSGRRASESCATHGRRRPRCQRRVNHLPWYYRRVKKVHVTQKWRSVSAAPRRPARAQNARLTRRPAPAREHAPRDPAPCTASRSHGPHNSTTPYSQHLAQHHTQSMHSHTHHLPSGGDLRLAGEIQKDSRSYIRSHRKKNVAHEQRKSNKHNNMATGLFQSTQRTIRPSM